MIKALGSKIDLSQPDTEYNQMVCDLISHEVVCQMKNYIQHGRTTTFQHCVNVSYYNYLICKLLSLDARAAARGGLLHDLFLYDWHTRVTPVGEHNHAIAHAGTALANAKMYFALDEKETDIIKKHMFPVNPALPKYSETVVITIVDKVCGVMEVLDYRRWEIKALARHFRYIRYVKGIERAAVRAVEE